MHTCAVCRSRVCYDDDAHLYVTIRRVVNLLSKSESCGAKIVKNIIYNVDQRCEYREFFF